MADPTPGTALYTPADGTGAVLMRIAGQLGVIAESAEVEPHARIMRRLHHLRELLEQEAVGGCMAEIAYTHVCQLADGHDGEPHQGSDGYRWWEEVTLHA